MLGVQRSPEPVFCRQLAPKQTSWKLLCSDIANSVTYSSLFVLVECADTVRCGSVDTFDGHPESVALCGTFHALRPATVFSRSYCYTV